VLRKSGSDATVQSCTKLYLNVSLRSAIWTKLRAFSHLMVAHVLAQAAAARVEWLYKESALVKARFRLSLSFRKQFCLFLIWYPHECRLFLHFPG
jgi:3'-phosphoadenosine 5'-phosphosulfate sulfotransferase